MKRTLWLLLLFVVAGGVSAQTTVSFNFSAGAQPVTGWINLVGDPSTAIRTATDATSGISISSIATANWAPLSGAAAGDGVGAPGGVFFPSAVMLNHWFQYSSAGIYNPALPQLMITGLHPDSVYTLLMTGSSPSTQNSSPTEYTVSGLSVSGAIAVNNQGNTASGAVFYNISPDVSGNIKVYINTLPSTNVADISGIRIVSGAAPSGRAGQGLTVNGGLIDLGDNTSGRGPHSFTSNRYQNLNGYMYSIGDSVNDPVNHPAFRIYNNGDLTAGTTMEKSVNTYNQTGLRYYAKPGYLQIGASDRIDTTLNPIVYGIWPSSGIIINSDDYNTINGKFMNTVFCSDASKVDTGVWMENNFVAGEAQHWYGPSNSFIRSWMAGYANQYSASMDACLVEGHSNQITKWMNSTLVAGGANITQDTSFAAMISGWRNQFGGWDQFATGAYHVNRTPYGAVFGNASVDFSTLPFTGLRGTNVAGIGNYPLFAVGNSAVQTTAATNPVHSNALTVLFNGRTQINTTGFTNNLAQTNVTPQAALDVVSTNTGVLLPRLNNGQRNAIASADLQNGLLLYNTDSSVFQYYNGTAWSSVGTGLGGRWQFLGGATYDSLDNVGIGTSNTQGYKLAVNGSAIFTRIKVKNASGWPDYVFGRDYRLPSLKEVARYIAGHSHLPGMPSAAQVVKEGQDVGETQAALLKKVEELTLYVIEQDKKMDVLQAEISRLKRRQGVAHRGKHKPIQ